MLIFVILLLIVIAVLWAFWTLSGLQKTDKIVHATKEELLKGRVVYHDSGKIQSSESTVEEDSSPLVS